jgi:cathepsin A (carboxypeptidase C)
MRKTLFLSLAALALIGVATAQQRPTDEVFLDEDQKSGLVSMGNGDDMFYWLFKSRGSPETDPLVIWLTGGPGCASEVALFYENGPYTINDDLTLNPNAQSWNKVSNLLYVDQPVGTGFSRCSSIFHYDSTEDEIAANIKTFLDGFLVANPEFRGRDFFITGESYAGHYIPAIAYHFVKEIPAGSLGLNFKGIAIGNGWVDPVVQYPQYAEFAYENNMVSFEMYLTLKASFAECVNLINNGKTQDDQVYALEVCQLTMASILGNPLAPSFNVYDIRKKCDVPPLCYNLSNSDRFLNNATIQAKLGVTGRYWVECDKLVHLALTGDWLNNLAAKMEAVLETGLSVLVYSGDKDFVCNWRGGEAWTNAVQWTGQTEFQGA